MIFIPKYHWNHTKFNFGMILVAIWYEYHTLVFAVYACRFILPIDKASFHRKRFMTELKPGKLYPSNVLPLHCKYYNYVLCINVQRFARLNIRSFSPMKFSREYFCSTLASSACLLFNYS